MFLLATSVSLVAVSLGLLIEVAKVLRHAGGHLVSECVPKTLLKVYLSSKDWSDVLVRKTNKLTKTQRE
jgi:hypothetical protein